MKFSRFIHSFLFFLAFFAFIGFTAAQDTLLFNAITYDSTSRDVIVAFPETRDYR